MAKDKNKSRYLLGTHISASGGVSKAPIAGEELGCSAIQIFTKNNMQWFAKDLDPKEVEVYRQNLKETNIKVVFSHAGYLINLAGSEKENYEKSMKSMLQELERSDQLGIPFVVLHPGSHKDKGIEWGIKLIADSINKLFDETKGSNVMIALETMAGQGSSVGGKFEELAEITGLVKDKKRIGYCFDTCHAFSAGYDLRDEKSFVETWQQFDKILGIKNLLAIHLNDSKKPFGDHKDRHEQIGEGELGKFPFWRILHDKRFENIPMVLETPKKDEAGKEMDPVNLKFLREMEKSSKV
ncbi:MAG: deoxyribonuclease IV [Pseudomonadota bacterium]